MRGKVVGIRHACDKDRITPAHAGKRSRPMAKWTRPQDHPRPCGEKVSTGKSASAIWGSPPPMRGKGPVVLLYLDAGGITPAHAGKR